MIKFKAFKNINKGYILGMTMILLTVTLTLGLSVSLYLYRELRISQLSRESERAYQVAETGMNCIMYLENEYGEILTDRVGFFPYNPGEGLDHMQLTVDNYNAQVATPLYGSNITLSSIGCFGKKLTSEVTLDFVPYSYQGQSGRKTTFQFDVPVETNNAGATIYRCFKAEVAKTRTLGASGVVETRQIISRGYNKSCDSLNTINTVERAVVNQSID